MKTQCPNCYSENINLIQCKAENSPIPNCSAEELSKLGKSICHNLGIAYPIGVIAGHAISAVLDLSNHQFAPASSKSVQFQCANCKHVFSQSI